MYICWIAICCSQDGWDSKLYCVTVWGGSIQGLNHVMFVTTIMTQNGLGLNGDVFVIMFSLDCFYAVTSMKLIGRGT